jgi:hypothetical protein
MATVDKAFADNIIRHNGYYDGNTDNSIDDNPPVVKIVKYDNAFGGVGYGLLFPDDDPEKYAASPFIGNPQTVWELKS